MSGLNGTRACDQFRWGGGARLFIHAQPDAGPWIPRLVLGGSVLILLADLCSRLGAGPLPGLLRFPPGYAQREHYPHLTEAQAEMVIRTAQLLSAWRLRLRGAWCRCQARRWMWPGMSSSCSPRVTGCSAGRASGASRTIRQAEYMATPDAARGGLRTWLQACHLEGIDPRKPARLPMLFAPTDCC